MEKCFICPRNCGVDRENEVGFCKAKNIMHIAYIMVHHYEEPIISGECTCDAGSGAIFFGGCNLACKYCQNYKISHECCGSEVSPRQLVEIFKYFEREGVYNINLVTPTHYTMQIVEALKIYKPQIPVVWNSSGYEKPETIELLKGLVDIFLVDLKYYSSEIAMLSNASNYFEYASKSILKMRELVPDDEIESGLMKHGLIIRHLVLPTYTADSLKILEWIKGNLGEKTIVSIMGQYLPYSEAKNDTNINRRLKPVEYKRVVNFALKLGLDNAYVQELESAEEFYTPNFEDGKSLLKKILYDKK